MSSKQYWSPTENILNCLIYRERTEAFPEAINNMVGGELHLDSADV